MNQEESTIIEINDTQLEHKQNDSDLSFHCTICMMNYTTDSEDYKPFKLSCCNHTYCQPCLFDFLASKISDGDVAPRCFYPLDKANNNNYNNTDDISLNDTGGALLRLNNDNNDSNINTSPSSSARRPTSNTNNTATKRLKTCDTILSTNDILSLIDKDPILLNKYTKFKYFKENESGRECPKVLQNTHNNINT